MYTPKFAKKFRKAYRKLLKSGSFDRQRFDKVFSTIISRNSLPREYSDHALEGPMSGLRECHISSDCVLIYKIDDLEKVIRLIDIGNHANLFGM